MSVFLLNNMVKPLKPLDLFQLLKIDLMHQIVIKNVLHNSTIQIYMDENV